MSIDPLRIIHVAEDELSACVSRELLNRIVLENCEPWMQDQLIDHPGTLHRFTKLTDSAGWADRSDVGSVSESRKLRLHPGGLSGNAALAYKCARLATVLAPESVLLLAFDSDHKPTEERLAPGIARAKADGKTVVLCVVAEATPEFDAWVLAGWSAENRHEETLLHDAKKRLADEQYRFDPLDHLDRLTSAKNTDPRDAKALCAELCGLPRSEQVGCDTDRASRCWRDTPLSNIENRGHAIGIPEFVRNVCEVVIPALTR